MTHTHWDREWYLPAARFRQRLVALVDEILADDPDTGSFLLDGQTVVLEDYLAVRPERRAELSTRLREGRLEAGPWYVLADELIPSGEALVRNLLAGRRTLRSLRAEPPRVLYCPDSFGHPAALPTIAAGFDLPVIILWRGYGGRRWPAGDVVRWHGPDGSSALIYHLPPSGYEFAASLPAEPAAAANRWERMRSVLAPRSTVGTVLLPNGADHHARQSLLPEAIAALEQAATGDRIIESSLDRFASALTEAVAAASVPSVGGELRDSYGYTWTLQGTFATRAHQKRANARVERLLLREAEPWSAIARARGAFSRRHLVDAAWTTLLLCHPHDTLCGCSIDDVAQAMDVRLESAAVQGRGVRDDALLDIIGHDPVHARSARSAWREVVIVRNAAARPRGGVAEIEVRRFLADVPVGPGSAHAPPPHRSRLAPPHLDGGRIPIQVLDRDVVSDRVESPLHYPDNDLVEVVTAVAWVGEIPPYGTVSHALDAPAEEPASPPTAVSLTGMMLSNGNVTVGFNDDGQVQLLTGSPMARLASLVRFEDVPDVGDLYTHSAGARVASHATFLGPRVVHRGPLRGVVEGRWRLRLPEPMELSVQITLDAGSDLVHFHVAGENIARDHRLRIVFATIAPNASIRADAAFGAVERTRLIIDDADRSMETPPGTAPLHRYVTTFGGDIGATLYSDGLAEYEALDDGIAVTLVRAVGELSRNDLPERPGHAGWPSPTPIAQCLGPFEAHFAYLVHGPPDSGAESLIERACDDALMPLVGSTLRSALDVPRPTVGVELRGDGLAMSSIKESEDGKALVLRCVNVTADQVEGQWVLPNPVRHAHLARLDEAVLEPIPNDGASIRFTAPPRAVVTIRAS